MENRKDESTHAAVCDYCGHIRCANCRQDHWPRLADGCCHCAERILQEAQRRVS
jgi:hypothetical protein